jgi:hypothetical protein
MKALLALMSPTTWAVLLVALAGLAALHVLRTESVRSSAFQEGKEQAAAVAAKREAAIMASFRDSMRQELGKANRLAATLQSHADQLQETKDAEVANLNRAVAELSERLRHRPRRPAADAAGGHAGLPGAPGAPASAPGAGSGLRVPDGGVSGWATGAQLYQDDALWLAEEARRAGELLATYKRDRAAYEKARAELSQVAEPALSAHE